MAAPEAPAHNDGEEESCAAASAAVAAAVARIEAERRATWPSEAAQAASIAASAVSPTAQLWALVESCGERDWNGDEPVGGAEGLRRLLGTRLADVNDRRGGDTPLLRAVRTHVDLCVGEINDGEAHAGTRHSLAAARLLLAAGADARARRGGGDNPGGASALQLAAACEAAAELRTLLLAHGAADAT